MKVYTRSSSEEAWAGFARSVGELRIELENGTEFLLRESGRALIVHLGEAPERKAGGHVITDEQQTLAVGQQAYRTIVLKPVAAK